MRAEPLPSGRAVDRPSARGGGGAALLVLAAALLAGGCTVKETYLREDYETTDKLTLKRVAVVVEVEDDAPAVVAELASRLVSRYVHLKTGHMILRRVRAEAHGGPPREQALAGADGALEVEVRDLEVGASETDATLEARLVRKDGDVLVWRCVGALSEGQEQEDLSRTIKRYVRELGPEAEPYIGPLFILTKRVFDTMPSPVLSDEDLAEKVELAP